MGRIFYVVYHIALWYSQGGLNKCQDNPRVNPPLKKTRIFFFERFAQNFMETALKEP
jgi:hypothetical protein